MLHLDFPDKPVWNGRNDWFIELLNTKQSLGSYFISEQATALLSELQAIYCCGAWNNVIILSVSIIDTQLREYEMPDHKGSIYDLASKLNFNPEFDWLRKKRNRLVHIDVNNLETTIDDYYYIKSSVFIS